MTAITVIDFDTIQIQPTLCVDQSVVDANMAYSINKVKGRISEGFDRGLEKVAVVCYGPSLIDEWEKIKDFKYIISCSGAHKFLIDRGIIPTWHVEADPRAHKIELMGDPHPDVEYLIASGCNPKLIDYLSDFKVSLWHVYRGELLNELPQSYPRGEWVFSGGSSAGLRCLILARFLGFHRIEVFGMDCSYPKNHANEHADRHPNPSAAENRIITMFDKVLFYTTPNLIFYAKEFFKETSKMDDVKLVVHGNGLLQRMIYRDYRDPTFSKQDSTPLLAVYAPKLISDEYLKLNRQLHEENSSYGSSGKYRAAVVEELSKKLATQNILDYGCGKGTLAQALPFPIVEYDPAIPGKDQEPAPADIVVCTDVLEHIEPDFLQFVLGDIVRCTKQLAYLVIHTGPAKKTLPDGRNTHLIQQGRVWWYRMLEKFFVIDDMQEDSGSLQVFCRPRLLSTSKGLNADNRIIDNDGIIFLNINSVTEWRANNLLTKEPITIEWLNSMTDQDVFLDIGANVGSYSLYAAAKRGVNTYAFEPESQNYAVLNYNINLNRLDKKIKAYCLSISDNVSLGNLMLTNMIPGQSCHQFNRTLSFSNKPTEFAFAQGSLSVTIDWLIENKMIPQPSHIKIDVDGIEDQVIYGAGKTLENTQSLLVEVNKNLPEHVKMVEFLQSKGFIYDADQVQRSERTEGTFKGVAEYVFTKSAAASGSN